MYNKNKFELCEWIKFYKHINSFFFLPSFKNIKTRWQNMILNENCFFFFTFKKSKK